MKIAFFTYPSAFQNVGGGEIQLLKTREYLQKLGVQVDLFDAWSSRIDDYDLLHIFSSVKDCLELAGIAKKRGVKVVTSPVLWSDMRRAFFTDEGWQKKGEYLLRHFLKMALPSFPSARRKLLALSDRLFPNSEMERQQIHRLFSIPLDKINVVYNGVDEGLVSTGPKFFTDKYGDEPFILSVGRIEPRKNQLNLIKAVKAAGKHKLVLIGNRVTGYEKYHAACLREGEGFVSFLPGVSHGDPELWSAYAACDLFVLQGWFETPGLVALEAGMAGAKVAATSGGSTKEYFNDFIDYFNPANPQDIKRSILKSLQSKNDGRLREHIRSHFTWDKIAKCYLILYEDILKSKNTCFVKPPRS